MREMKIVMREVRFRGKLMLGKHRWVKGFYVRVNDNHVIIPGGVHSLLDYKRCEPETIGQYTGLKDRNGREIYEGDILHDHFCNNRYVVHFDCGSFDVRSTLDRSGNYLSEVAGDVEVIGNVFDNPELMK